MSRPHSHRFSPHLMWLRSQGDSCWPGDSSPWITHCSPFRTEIGSLWKGLFCALVSDNKKSPHVHWLTCPSWQHQGTQRAGVLEGLARQPASLVGSSLTSESTRGNRMSLSQRQWRSLYINRWTPKKSKPQMNRQSSLPFTLSYTLS